MFNGPVIFLRFLRLQYFFPKMYLNENPLRGERMQIKDRLELLRADSSPLALFGPHLLVEIESHHLRPIKS